MCAGSGSGLPRIRRPVCALSGTSASGRRALPAARRACPPAAPAGRADVPEKRTLSPFLSRRGVARMVEAAEVNRLDHTLRRKHHRSSGVDEPQRARGVGQRLVGEAAAGVGCHHADQLPTVGGAPEKTWISAPGTGCPSRFSRRPAIDDALSVAHLGARFAVRPPAFLTVRRFPSSLDRSANGALGADAGTQDGRHAQRQRERHWLSISRACRCCSGSTLGPTRWHAAR